MARVGCLAGISEEVSHDLFEAFRQRLRELKYLEGQTIVIDYRWAEGRGDRLESLAGELERGPRPRRALEEYVDERAAAQQVLLLVGAAVERDVGLARSSRSAISPGDSPSMPNRWRCGKTMGSGTALDTPES